MTAFRNVIEIIIVVLCLPFYAFVIPFLEWDRRSVRRRIQEVACPFCGELFSDITTHDIVFCGLRLRLNPDTQVDWNRLPKLKVTCKSCRRDTCFDREIRLTSCDISDAITHPIDKAKRSQRET